MSKKIIWIREKILSIFRNTFLAFMIACTYITVWVMCTDSVLSYNVIIKPMKILTILNLIIIYTIKIVSTNRYTYTEIEPNFKAILKPKDSEKNENEEYSRQVAAMHEAGHALMAYLLNIPISHIYSTCVCYELPTFLNSDYLEKYLQIVYAGACAEELYFGFHHNGCSGDKYADFEKAKDIIKTYIVETNPNVSKLMLDTELQSQMIDISKQYYQECKCKLSKNLPLLEELSKEIFRNGKLTKQEIETFFSHQIINFTEETLL